MGAPKLQRSGSARGAEPATSRKTSANRISLNNLHNKRGSVAKRILPSKFLSMDLRATEFSAVPVQSSKPKRAQVQRNKTPKYHPTAHAGTSKRLADGGALAYHEDITRPGSTLVAGGGNGSRLTAVQLQEQRGQTSGPLQLQQQRTSARTAK